MTYQLKIKLRGITKPPVWRRLLVPSDCTFHILHCIIQESFGWEYEHLYEFKEKPYDHGWTIKDMLDDGGSDDFLDFFYGSSKPIDSRTMTIGKFLNENPIKKFTYIYDFGDDWIHDITVEAETDEILIYPRCIAGKGACPPEDCGGVWGYENMKMVLAETPRSKDAKMYREWLGLGRGEKFDPNALDLDEANKQIIGIWDFVQKNLKE